MIFNTDFVYLYMQSDLAFYSTDASYTMKMIHCSIQLICKLIAV